MKFVKVFDVKRFNQVAMLRTQDESGAPCVKFYFHPDGYGVCSFSIGWDNDIWALDVQARRYHRLTNLDAGQGLQTITVSDDGKWFVYPLRYDKGNARKNFGKARMVFCEIAVDAEGGVKLLKRFEEEPNGPMYYEPSDIRKNPSGTYTLLYAAGSGVCMDPYEYEWSFDGENHAGAGKALASTPDHEEFFTFSPSGKKIAWMRGPVSKFRYLADLYVSSPDFSGVERVTWYNDSKVWPERAKRHGCQFSRLEWNGDGTAIYFDLWIHAGPLRPFHKTELHRIDFKPTSAIPSSRR